MIKLTWRNSCDLGGIYYGGDFENKLFLDTVIVKPEYTFEEEGVNNDEGSFIKDFESLVKTYKFEVVAPEYIANAMTLMALHDDVKIFVPGLYMAQIRNIKVNVTWEDTFNDCMALIEVTFQQDDQVVKSACCT